MKKISVKLLYLSVILILTFCTGEQNQNKRESETNGKILYVSIENAKSVREISNDLLGSVIDSISRLGFFIDTVLMSYSEIDNFIIKRIVKDSDNSHIFENVDSIKKVYFGNKRNSGKIKRKGFLEEWYFKDEVSARKSSLFFNKTIGEYHKVPPSKTLYKEDKMYLIVYLDMFQKEYVDSIYSLVDDILNKR